MNSIAAIQKYRQLIFELDQENEALELAQIPLERVASEVKAKIRQYLAELTSEPTEPSADPSSEELSTEEPAEEPSTEEPEDAPSCESPDAAETDRRTLEIVRDACVEFNVKPSDIREFIKLISCLQKKFSNAE